ncbi:MAG: hypothetical protein ACI8S6_005429 [Myxococcota bacterium]|jgi:hypothetical protein
MGESVKNQSLLVALLLGGCVGGGGDKDTAVDTGGVSADCFLDSAGDGFGDSDAAGDCLLSGYVSDGGDCDDTDADVSPAADEVCDGIDNDCSGAVDGADALDASAWYADGDSDGYGSEDAPVYDCEAPSGRIGQGGDCDDTDSDISPAAEEACYDSIDSNCDGADNLTGCSLSLTDADATLAGVNSLDLAGYSIASAGDINADGFDDVLVGARLEDSGGADAGITYVVFGPVSDMSLADADAKITGAAAGDYAGIHVDGGSDYDGDGTPDVVIGAQFVYDGGGAQVGAAYVVYGPVSDMSLSSADVTLLGVGDGDQAGRVVAMSGDVDGDGIGDVLVGARNNDASYTNAGVAYLVHGATTSGVLDTAGVALLGAAAQDGAGYSLSRGGDIDADGLADVLVGAYRADDGTVLNVGVSYVLLGGGALSGLTAGDSLSLASADVSVFGATEKEQAGSSLGPAGDVDGDGYDDILIGTQYYDSSKADNVGIAYLMLGGLSGSVSVTDAAASFVGLTAEDAAGRSVATAGDQNGDGLSDLLIGAKEVDDGATDAGAAYLFLGPATGALTMAQANGAFIGDRASGQAGTAVAAGGDVNADGRPDMLIGGSGADGGHAYVILGGDW